MSASDRHGQEMEDRLIWGRLYMFIQDLRSNGLIDDSVEEKLSNCVCQMDPADPVLAAFIRTGCNGYAFLDMLQETLESSKNANGADTRLHDDDSTGSMLDAVRSSASLENGWGSQDHAASRSKGPFSSGASTQRRSNVSSNTQSIPAISTLPRIRTVLPCYRARDDLARDEDFVTRTRLEKKDIQGNWLPGGQSGKQGKRRPNLMEDPSSPHINWLEVNLVDCCGTYFQIIGQDS